MVSPVLQNTLKVEKYSVCKLAKSNKAFRSNFDKDFFALNGRSICEAVESKAYFIGAGLKVPRSMNLRCVAGC